ncbi:MAG: dephospho-CoA kinase [Alphaproteobacteria bacterium]|nr:dephospho-CoA kinase [Alphaproteobacteria bacterium]
MIVLGLSGSIGMGKSTASAMFRRMGVPVYDSDAAVHVVLGRGGAAVPPIAAAFPGVVTGGAVDRQALGKRVFGDDAALKALEAIVHPLVRRRQDDFLKRCSARRVPLAALDIPLLFEVRLDVRCDVLVVVSAPARIQAARVLARPGMTQDKFDGILARQMPDAEKRRLADFVVPSGRGKAETLRRLTRIARLARDMTPSHWPPDMFAEKTVNRRSPDARNRPRYRNHRA